MPVLLILLAAAVALVVLLVLSRANEIFYVSIRDGRCLVIRGRVSPALWRELTAVARMARIERGAVRAVKDGGAARLVTEGIDEGTAQRLRNALGTTGFGGAKASAPAGDPATRNLGQLLGLALLAWLLLPRR